MLHRVDGELAGKDGRRLLEEHGEEVGGGVLQTDHKEEEKELEPLDDVRAGDLKQVFGLELLKHAGLELDEVIGDEKGDWTTGLGAKEEKRGGGGRWGGRVDGWQSEVAKARRSISVLAVSVDADESSGE